MPWRDRSVKLFPCLGIWPPRKRTFLTCYKTFIQQTNLWRCSPCLGSCKSLKWKSVIGCCFVILQTGKESLVNVSLFHGIYAVNTMTCSQSPTPKHLNSSDMEPINSIQNHILGKRRLHPHSRSERRRYSECKPPPSLTAAHKQDRSSQGFTIRECDLQMHINLNQNIQKKSWHGFFYNGILLVEVLL